MLLSDKIFVQLSPDESSKDLLMQLSKSLGTKENTLIPRDVLHMTVIHIGKLERTYNAIRAKSYISEDDFLAGAEKLYTALKIIRKRYESIIFSLSPNEVRGFGPRNATLVLTFDHSEILTQLYRDSFAALKDFLVECGIKNSIDFMHSDPNLINALTLRPHVSLARSAQNSSLNIPTDNLCFSIMNIHYPS